VNGWTIERALVLLIIVVIVFFVLGRLGVL
jgi:hypothetical protein